MLKQSYNEQEAEEILRRSIARQAEVGGFHSEHAPGAAGGVSSDDLAKMAAELGVAPEVVQQVEEEWRTKLIEEKERREFIDYQRRDFFGHFLTYLIVNALLLAINWATEGRITWAVWPLMGWGIGLLFGAKEAFLTAGDDFEEAFEKWRKKRRKRSRAED